MTNPSRQHDAQVDAQMLDRAARNIRLKVGDLAAPTPGKAQADESAPAVLRRPARAPAPVGAGHRG